MSKFEMTTIPFHNTTHKRRAKNPSFSSILLDAIYRSIDEDDELHEYPRTTPTSPTRSITNRQSDCSNKNNIQSSSCKQRRNKMRSDSTLETVDLRRAIMIESWMERQTPQQPPQQPPQRKHFHLGDVLDEKIRFIRQKSVPSLPRPSENSSTTDFSSSSSSCFTNLTPRSTTSRDHHSSSKIFTKTKSRALKIYGELKRSKQQNTAPISPGRRIATFLNSIFRNSGTSPARNSPEIKSPPPKTVVTTTATNSTCSTASSFSRSCLSNKTTSSGKSSKRSVRFYPVSVIVDEDSRPCGHKSIQKNENQQPKKLESPLNEQHSIGGESDEKRRRRRREKEIDALMMMMIKTNCGNIQQRHVKNLKDDFDDDEEMEEEEEDDDGAGSCASSDLFELENLSSIGVSRYYEELPVYGTTSLSNLTA